MTSLRPFVVAFIGLVAVASSASAAAGRFATTTPSRVGDERYVRASYSVAAKQTERTVIKGRVKVLSVDAAGAETAGSLEIEKCMRIVDGVEHQLLAPGERMLLKRGQRGRVELLREDGAALPKEISRWTSLVTGLRGGSDDLDFWNGGNDVDEARLRKVIATTDFPLESVKSETRATPGEFAARLSIPEMVGKPGKSTVVGGTFAVECRWRVGERLERFRRTRWVLHEKREGDVAPTRRVVEIVGIESATPQPWWAKSAEEVSREAARFAAANDPLVGFYSERDPHETSGGTATPEFEQDEITLLLKIR